MTNGTAAEIAGVKEGKASAPPQHGETDRARRFPSARKPR